MNDAGSATSTAEQDLQASGRRAGGGPGTLAPGGSLPPATELARQAIERHPWLASAGLLARLGVLAGAGAAARLVITPGTAGAVAAWAVVALVLAVPLYRATSPRASRGTRPPGAWQPGQAPPAGVSAATTEAATRAFAQLPSRWRGAWLEIAPCTDPVRHGQCREASVVPVGDAMIRVILGEHIAARPADAAFVVAHEVRHPAGWTRHLSLIATAARQAGWLAAGWAVPWPWLPAAAAAVQAAHTAACWITEAGCDLGGARVAGRDAALGFFAHRQALDRQPKPGPALRRHAHSLLIAVAVPTAHPPWWLRATIVRALTPGRGPA